MRTVTRFAPSPTGLLHLGHAYAAWMAWRRAREAGGRFLLRIEDIDRARSRSEFVLAIKEDLLWLGFCWDEAIRVQSEHFEDYAGALRVLEAEGLLYPCFCTRADILEEVNRSASAQHAPSGGPVYPGTCRALGVAERRERIEAGQKYALRLDMQLALARVSGPLWFEEEGEGRVYCCPERFGDVVLARKDTPASYHLCVTYDDAVQGVTLVTRAEDLKPATHVHRLLQALLGLPTPRYAHHPLVRDSNGVRLAKRHNAPSLRSLREAGFSAEAVRAMIAQVTGSRSLG